MDEQSTPQPTIVTAVVFEGLLGLAAIGVGGFLGYAPGRMIHWTLPGAGWGLLASLPLVVVFWLAVRFPVGPLGRLLQIVKELVMPLFRRATMLELAIVSLVAGLGEEALFRGVVQTALADKIGGSTGIWTALAVASVLFGLAHFVTVTYAVIAAILGAYLGWLWIVSGNLLVPITAHAMYDFLALIYLARIQGQQGGGP